jgi:hypothetical protein
MVGENPIEPLQNIQFLRGFRPRPVIKTAARNLKGGLAVLLAFQPVADGKNSRRPKLETGHSANDVNAVEALCRRRCRILFFQKNPSPPSGSQVPSPCSQPGIDYVSLAKGARSPQPAGRAASRNVFDLPRRVQAEAIPGPPTAMRRPRPFGERG